jgi:hypothetical protein
MPVLDNPRHERFAQEVAQGPLSERPTSALATRARAPQLRTRPPRDWYVEVRFW